MKKTLFSKNAIAFAVTTAFLVACGPQPESTHTTPGNAVVSEKIATTADTSKPEATTALPLLWSDDHSDVITLASSLISEPQIQAVRAQVVTLYTESPSGQIADGQATMADAVDHMIFGSLLSTVSTNLTTPSVVWSETMPYRVGDQLIPDSRYAGETPDRIYQNVAVSSDYRYELHGHRPNNHSLEFIVEALPGPANWGLPPLAAIHSDAIDYAEDGSFMITMDNSATKERRNHLQLPPGTKLLLIRDSVIDWQHQLPTKVTVKGLDTEIALDIPRDELIASSAKMIVDAAKTSLAFYNGIWARDTNQLTTYVRDLGWGIVGLNPFSIADDEALVVTINPLGASYFTFQVDNLWLRSVDYIEQTSSLNLKQSQMNPDGTITFVVATQDPGYHNWINTGGLKDGFLVARWELFSKPTNGEGAVVSVSHVNMHDLSTVMPESILPITAEQRSNQLAFRQATFGIRLGK